MGTHPLAQLPQVPGDRYLWLFAHMAIEKAWASKSLAHYICVNGQLTTAV